MKRKKVNHTQVTGDKSTKWIWLNGSGIAITLPLVVTTHVSFLHPAFRVSCSFFILGLILSLTVKSQNIKWFAGIAFGVGILFGIYDFLGIAKFTNTKPMSNIIQAKENKQFPSIKSSLK